MSRVFRGRTSASYEDLEKQHTCVCVRYVLREVFVFAWDLQQKPTWETWGTVLGCEESDPFFAWLCFQFSLVPSFVYLSNSVPSNSSFSFCLSSPDWGGIPLSFLSLFLILHSSSVSLSSIPEYICECRSHMTQRKVRQKVQTKTKANRHTNADLFSTQTRITDFQDQGDNEGEKKKHGKGCKRKTHKRGGDGRWKKTREEKRCDEPNSKHREKPWHILH